MKSLADQLATPALAASPLSMRKASARWWWTESKRHFQLFKGSHYVQGYELLRRLLKSQIFFYQNPNTTWRQLPHAKRALFHLSYKRVLEKMGLVRRISFYPTAIYFDCRMPPYYLIRALEQELRKPTPLVAGTNIQPFLQKPLEVKGWSADDYTKRPKWERAFEPELYMIRLHLPRPLPTGDRILSCFTSFVRDKPPDDFAKHCLQFPPLKPKNSPFNKPTTLALALMHFDFGDIPKLARWLVKNPSTLEILGIAGTEAGHELLNRWMVPTDT